MRNKVRQGSFHCKQIYISKRYYFCDFNSYRNAYSGAKRAPRCLFSEEGQGQKRTEHPGRFRSRERECGRFEERLVISILPNFGRIIILLKHLNNLSYHCLSIFITALKLLDGGGKGGKNESKYREMCWKTDERGKYFGKYQSFSLDGMRRNNLVVLGSS